MKSLKRLVLSLCLAVGSLLSANAIGWPANYQGVMLQGFYWDSYTSETKWSKLEQKADEYSQYFSLIWVPNSAKSSGGLGYLPVYWFTNHSSAMGTEAQLRSMINTYKSKGVGIIADVVINHRVGVSNWTNFPRETWNGVTYQIGLDGIC
ncbi:MAG: alpha-amylase, partial [Muribaculaceae bacterium]|nr:alpha-amylase [Muribaculaceae bacterium]